MVTKVHEQHPHEVVQALREKIEKAKLTREQIEKLKPPSLGKRDHCDLPPYVPGAYRKQCEEARKRLEKLDNQRQPGFVPKQVQDKYLNEFYELKAQGKVSHLSPEMLQKLEMEVKESATNVKKHAELEEFLSSLRKQTAIPAYQHSTERLDTDLQGSNSVNPQGNRNENREKKKSVIKVRTHDGGLVPCFVIFESSLLCDTPLIHTGKNEIKERNGPVKVASRTAQEVLEALNLVTEYIQLNDLEKYLEGLKLLEKTLRQKI